LRPLGSAPVALCVGHKGLSPSAAHIWESFETFHKAYHMCSDGQYPPKARLTEVFEKLYFFPPHSCSKKKTGRIVCVSVCVCVCVCAHYWSGFHQCASLSGGVPILYIYINTISCHCLKFSFIFPLCLGSSFCSDAPLLLSSPLSS